MSGPKLKILVVGAQNLELVSEEGYSEPKCVIQLGVTRSTMAPPKKSEKSLKKRNPNIKKSVTFDKFDIHEDKLKVEFWDIDENTNTDVKIGESSLDLSTLGEEDELITLNLTQKSTISLFVSPIAFPKKSPMPIEVVKQNSNPSDSKLSSSPMMNSSSSNESFHNSPQTLSPSSSSLDGSSNKSIPIKNLNNLTDNLSQSSDKPMVHNYQKPKYVLTYYNQEEIKRDFPQLARGSYGTVYTGYVPGIPDKVVIKDMEIRDQNTITEWKKEIDMMNKTRCSYVVDVIGYSSKNNILTIVMEFMPKGSLYSIIHEKKEKLSLIQRMRMARHCALGLEYLHSKGIIHRDIKSMNILVSGDYSCKLTDFGTAKSLTQGNMQFQLNTANSGTPLWMAPEVKLGMQYDYSADVYSLGLVLYELFEQKLPHFNQMTQSVELPRSFLSSKIVFSCMNSDPKKRPKASSIVGSLNDMINNILMKVREHLSKEDKDTLAKLNNGTDDEEAEILSLYKFLLQKKSEDVDVLISKAFGDPDGKGFSQPQQSQQQQHQQMYPQHMPYQQQISFQPHIQPNYFPQSQMMPQFQTPMMPQYGFPQPHFPQYGFPPM